MDLYRRSRQRRAIEQGEYVMADVAGSDAVSSVRTGQSVPWRLECHYTDPATGTVHVWFSRMLTFNPHDMIKTDKIPVYLDRDDPKYAFVDVDAVLPRVEVHR